MATMISLVSEQTVPNILAIWQFQPENLLFVSTEKMEASGKSAAIINTVNLRSGQAYRFEKNTKVITVDEASLSDCLRKLDDWIRGKEGHSFIVNLTGGTKIMSIAIFEFFKNYRNEMIYIPFGKNEFIELFPLRSPQPPLCLTHRLNVKEYLTAYGLSAANEGKAAWVRRQAEKRVDQTQWIINHYAELYSLLSRIGRPLREERKKMDNNKKRKTFKLIENAQSGVEKEFFRRFGFTEDQNTGYAKRLDKDGIQFFTGGWLEEYCYSCVKDAIGACVDDAVLSINVKNPSGTENEFDIMFTSRNALYFIECKSLEQGHIDNKEQPKQTRTSSGFNDFLYKLGALQRDFGLSAQSYLISTSTKMIDEQTGSTRRHLEDRARQLRTKIIGPDKLPDLRKLLAADLSKV